MAEFTVPQLIYARELAQHTLALDPKSPLMIFSRRIIPTWDKPRIARIFAYPETTEERFLSREIAMLLRLAAINQQAMVIEGTEDGLAHAFELPCICYPQKFCMALAIARALKKNDAEFSAQVIEKAEFLVDRLELSPGLDLVFLLDQFCLTGHEGHLQGKDFCGSK